MQLLFKMLRKNMTSSLSFNLALRRKHLASSVFNFLSSKCFLTVISHHVSLSASLTSNISLVNTLEVKVNPKNVVLKAPNNTF